MSNNKAVIYTIVASVAGMFIAANASASTTGAYAGGQLGWGNIHQNGFSGLANNSSNDKGIAGRVFAGYQFNENFAAETGYTRFHNMTANGSDTIFGAPFDVHGVIKAYSVDIVAKGILPLQNGFSVYGKAGAAYLRETATVTATMNETVRFADSQNKVLPTYGLGVNYDLNTNVSTDLSWTRIQKVGHTGLGNTDLVAFGLAYHFG